MRKLILLAALLIPAVTFGQSGNWQKDVVNKIVNRSKSDSVTIVPRDTSPTNLAILPSTGLPVGDYGRIAAKHGKFYFHDSTRNRRIAFYGESAPSKIVQTIAALSLLSAPDSIVFVTDTIRGGYFTWAANGSADGGVIFAGSAGFYRRQFNHAAGINARWFGLSANGVADDADRIQAAIDRASTDSINKVIVPPGHYLIGTALKLPSNFILQADQGAYIELEPGSNEYLVRNEDLTNGNNNIKVIGGRWNGNGWTQTRTLGGSVATSNFCYGFFFHKSQDIEVSNLEIDSTRSWAIAAMVCNRVNVHDIHFEQNPYKADGVTPALGENGDGFTFNASNVTVNNLWGFTNDDMVAPAAGGASFGDVMAPFEQLDYENITISNIYPGVRDTIPTWRAVGCYAFGGHKITNLSINNISGTTCSGMVFIGDALANRGYFYNIVINNVQGNNRKVGASDPTQFGIISIAAATIDDLIINGGNRVDTFATSHVNITDSTYINRLDISNINIQYKGVLGRLVSDGGIVRRLNISNIVIVDSLGITGQRLYDRATSPFNTDTVVIKASNTQITRPVGFSTISVGSGKVSFSSTSVIVPDATAFAARSGDIVVSENNGLAVYRNGAWGNMVTFDGSGNALISGTYRSATSEGLRIIDDASFISFYNSANTTRSGFIQVQPGGATIRTDLNAPINFATNGSTKLVITETGELQLGTVKWITGSGSPEGVVTAPAGSFYSNTSGGAGTSWYVKESGSGNTGWVAK